MKFRMYFGGIKTALIVLVILAGATIIILDAIMISGSVPSLITANRTIAAVSLAAAAIVATAAALLLFNSFYKLRDDDLYVMLGFFGDEIEYSDVRTIKVNAVTKEVFVTYRKQEEEEEKEYCVHLNLNRAQSEKILKELTDKCAFAVVEMFDPPANKIRK